jgi:exodeoxyribonuclease VII large subunit
MAVPVRAELAAGLAELDARRVRAMGRALEQRGQRLGLIARAMPRAEELVERPRQRLAVAAGRLPKPSDLVERRRQRLAVAASRLPRPGAMLDAARQALAVRADRLPRALAAATRLRQERFERQARRLDPRLVGRPVRLGREAVGRAASRLAPAIARVQATRAQALAALARMLAGMSEERTLARGFAIVRSAEGAVLTRAGRIAPGAALDLEFADGHVKAEAGGDAPAPSRRKAPAKPRTTPRQPSLFDEG